MGWIFVKVELLIKLYILIRFVDIVYLSVKCTD